MLRRLWHQTRQQLHSLQQAAAREAKAKERASNNHRCRSDPYRFCNQLFAPPTPTAEPTFTSDTCKTYFSKLYDDPLQHQEYPSPTWLPSVQLPTFPFAEEEITAAEFNHAIRKSRATSAPGPNGIQYAVYKYCPKTRSFLHCILNRIWGSATITAAWQTAKIILLAKTKDGTDPSKFRPIALGNVEGKLFFSIMQQRLANYMLQNSYFPHQKGFLPGKAGCIEHSTITAEAMKDARKYRKDLTITWVDFANAFGSPRHTLLQFALKHFHIPPHMCNIFRNYYSSLSAAVHTQKWTTDTFSFRIGVFQGCTASPVLFNMVIQLAILFIDKQHASAGYKFGATNATLRIAAFADDIELVSRTAAQNQNMLDSLTTFAAWPQTMLKPEKCLCICYSHHNRKFSSIDPNLTISSKKVAPIGDKDFKYLGRYVSASMSETSVRQRIQSTVLEMCETLSKANLNATLKLWLYQHYMLPKVSWLLMVHDLSLDFVTRLDKKLRGYIKRWLTMIQGANTDLLYCGTQKRPGLRLKHLHTLYKQLQVIRLDIIRHATDPDTRAMYEVIKQRESTYTKQFAPSKLLATAETELRVTKATTSQRHRRGLGARGPHFLTERRQLTNIVAELDCQQQLTKLQELQMQGNWAKWTATMNQDFSWKRLLFENNDKMILFSLKAKSTSCPPRTASSAGASLSQTHPALCASHSSPPRSSTFSTGAEPLSSKAVTPTDTTKSSRSSPNTSDSTSRPAALHPSSPMSSSPFTRLATHPPNPLPAVRPAACSTNPTTGSSWWISPRVLQRSRTTSL